MFALAAPVTRVSWRSHRVKRIVACTSAAEAKGLSEAIAQGDWVRALWSEMVLELSLREWRERKEVPPLISVKGQLRSRTFEVAGACGRNVDTCDTDANRDLTRNPFLTLKPCHVIQPSGSRTSLRDQCFFCHVHILWSFASRSALVPLKSVAIPETVLTSLLLRHYKQLSSGLHTLSSQSYSPAHACALFCICRANFDHVEHVTHV